MPYVLVTDFKQGLDKRRMAVASPPGTLQQAKNAHINRGGEVEKAKAWVNTYALPANTFALEATAVSLYAFGSIVAPVMPAGVLYQRLQHPDDLAMASIISTEIFSGKIYAIAEYSDGKRFHFYDGTIIGDWYEGIVRATMTDLPGIATHLAALVDLDADYAAAPTSNSVVMTGPNGRDIVVTTTAANGGVNSDQTLAIVETSDGLSSITEVRAAGALTIYGGSANAGVNKISSITVNGVTITSASVDFGASNEVTAQALADNINAYTSAPDYTAAANGATLTISAAVNSGSTPNGFVVQATVAGNVIMGTGSFNITDGTAGAGNQVTSVIVNGVTITTAAVLWATSHSATAAAVVTNINANSGVSGYCAFSDPGSSTFLVGKLIVNGTTPGGLNIKATSGGTVRIDDQAAAGVVSKTVNTSVVNMKNGVAAYAGTGDVWTATVGGTFDVGDKFTISINDPVRGPVEFGASRVGGLQASTALLTHKKKLYASSASILAFSGVSNPTGWGSDAIGAGTINIADEFNGSINVTALAPYQGNLAAFSRRAIQIWAMDPDPALNSQIQVLSNIGTPAANSVKPFSELDVFFLSDTGVRSLRARSNTDTATVSDLGTPIDDLIVEAIRTLSDTVTAAALAEIEPTTGRYILQLGPTMYVFTYFGGAKISAWTTYEPGVTFGNFAVLGNRLYGRSGDNVYLLGGAQNISYDTSQTIVELPYLDGRQVATWKSWIGFDVACEGTWDVYVSTDPNNPTQEDYLGQISATTFTMLNIPMVADGPLLKMRFVNATAAYARISMVVAHYNKGDAE